LLDGWRQRCSNMQQHYTATEVHLVVWSVVHGASWACRSVYSTTAMHMAHLRPDCCQHPVRFVQSPLTCAGF
jgi:hypothetical protein